MEAKVKGTQLQESLHTDSLSSCLVDSFVPYIADIEVYDSKTKKWSTDPSKKLSTQRESMGSTVSTHIQLTGT